MKVVLAPDKFKGTLTAAEVAAELAAGWRSVRPGDHLVAAPMADGGTGTVQVLADAIPGSRTHLTDVVDALGRPRRAPWVRLPDGRAVVEAATAIGLDLLDPAERDPFAATSAGVGQLLAAAAASGVTRILVGLGGTATVDGGAGAAAALGHTAHRADGREVVVGRDRLDEVDRVRLGPPLGARVVGLADVTNPLLGPDGAAAVYGPQKGATAAQVPLLDRRLARYADAVETACGDGRGGPDVAGGGRRRWRDVPGAGAAGGLGFALLALLAAELRSGAEVMAELVGLEDALVGADLVVTGEGRLDGQTGQGKAPDLVRRRARARGVPVAVVAGVVEDGAAQPYDVALELGPDGPIRAAELVRARGAELARRHLAP